MNRLPQTTRLAGKIVALTGVALLTLCSAQAKSSRKDVVIMTNGDRITCEVKSLQNGILYLKPDYVAENIGVDWAQVQRVDSSATYQITLIDGTRMIGSIHRELPTTSQGAEARKDMVITSVGGNLTRVPASQVAEISTQKPTFLRQLTGGIDVGYSFTSGNAQSTLNTDASASYQTPKSISSAAMSNSFSASSGSSQTNREDLTLSYERFLSHNSYLGALNDYLHSSQQDLDLRITTGGGYGRYLIRTNTTGFRWIAGAVYTWEAFTTATAQPNDSNVEGLLGTAYDSYRFRVGEIHLQANLFPGLSDAGRVRLTTNDELRIKLVNNFYVSFDFWDNYDSRPPVSVAKKNELGVSSSIGWTF